MKLLKLLSLFAVLAILISACSAPILSASINEPENGRRAGAPPMGSINGWVWHDECISRMDGEPPLTETPAGCAREESAIGPYHANGTMEANEKPIGGATVRLGEGTCPSTGLDQFVTVASDLSYSFLNLKAGTYCVSIDPYEKANQEILLPGMWTSPAVQEGLIGITVKLASGENKFNINFGWDHQFKPEKPAVGSTGPRNTNAEKHYNFQGVSFVLDPAVSIDADGELLPEKPGSENNPYWEIKPETVRISLVGYPLADTTLRPVIEVYPAADYKRLSDQAGKSIDNLMEILGRKQDDPRQMPLLPIINAGQVFHSSVQYLDFRNGSGVRYLTVLAQYPAPVNNQDLIYTYQGLTADGRFYVSIILPVSHVSLPASPNALSVSELEQIAKDPAYYPAMSARLSALSGSSFTPDLAKLDTIVASLAIER